MKTALFIATSLAIVTASARGQSINIDYGSSAGTPAIIYEGAGVRGLWNPVPGGAIPQKLMDVRGRTTNATITLSSGGVVTMDDSNTAGDDEALLDDGILGGGDVVFTVTIEGLRPDEYEVIIFGWTPTHPGAGTALFYDDAFQVVGGLWPGGLEAPITHDIRLVNASDGRIEVGFAGATFGDAGFLNGIQLVRLTPADFNRDGIVGALDLLALLANWGPCAPDCPGNVNGDDVVDATDFLLLFAEWG